MDNEYGVIKQTKPQFPVKELLVVPHREDKNLTMSFPAFGPNNYKGNLESIGKTYTHPVTGEKINFKPATTSKSISAVAHGFGNQGEVDAKRDIFDARWLQAGYSVITQDGVYVNTTELNETKLKQLIDKAEKVNGIYLGENDFGFAPSDSFETGVQDCDTFAQGGLARVLENTSKKIAPKLREIASPRFYKRGVRVWGFDEVKEPVLKVASLGSYRIVGGGRLDVGGFGWDDYCSGYAFGELVSEKGK